MPRRNSNQQRFYYTRKEVEYLFEKLFEKTINCNQCKQCVHCKRADLVHVEVERKGFYTRNKNVEDWKVRYKGLIKRLMISQVF